MRLRVLNAGDVKRLLPMADCIELMRHAMKLVATGGTVQPIRTAVLHPDGRGLVSLMPGYTAEPNSLGVKLVSVFPKNFGTQFKSHQGMVLMFETEHGCPVGLVDGGEITAIRTAAATAVATDLLARKDARTLSFIGYGHQAEAHVEALLQVRDFARVMVAGRDLAKAAAFIESLHCRVKIEAVSVEEAAAADVVTTVTASAEPVFFARWLRPGQHLNVVGSSIPTTSEIDNETVAQSRFFVDFTDSALALAGDFRRAKAAGLVDDSHIQGQIGDILAGTNPGRVSAEEVTLFKSLGMVSEDLVSCDFVLKQAEQQGVGQVVEW